MLVVIVEAFTPPIDFGGLMKNYGVKSVQPSASVAIAVSIEMILILSMMNNGVKVATNTIPSTATVAKRVIATM
jgi:hypothetical protein